MQDPIQKTADTQYPIHSLLAERWSPRAFSNQPIAPEVLGSLFEAARWSPSASNQQPWRFVIVRQEDTENHAQMVETLAGFNQMWAVHAPVLVVGVAETISSHSGKPNAYAWYDLGQAIAHLNIQASATGLHLHQMGGFDREKARSVLEIPEGFEPVVTFAIGYLGDTANLPDPLRERETAPRSRRPLAENLFDGKWGEAANL